MVWYWWDAMGWDVMIRRHRLVVWHWFGLVWYSVAVGLCGSTANLSPEEQARFDAEMKKNREVDESLQKAQDIEKQIYKLLLLGAGESGKSTLFKQMTNIYGYVSHFISYTILIICRHIISSSHDHHLQPTLMHRHHRLQPPDTHHTPRH